MRVDHQARRRAPLAVLSLGLVIALLGPATSSVADPNNPSDSELQSARTAVSVGVRAVADIEVQLALQSATRETAYASAAAAGEAYLLADQERLAAEAGATRAAELLATANAEMETSRRTLVSIAISAARSGVAMDGVQAFLSADGFDDVVERSTALSRMGEKADRAVQQFRATSLVAEALSTRAADAVAKRARTAAEAEAALATAHAAQADADAAVAAAAAQREILIVELAAARSTTAEIERARQDQIDADRAARASAAAEAARTAVAPSSVGGSSPATPSDATSSDATSPAADPPVVASPETPSVDAAPTAPPVVVPPVAAPPVTSPPVVVPPVVAPPVTTPVVTPPVVKPPAAKPTPSGNSRGSAAQGAAAVAWAKAQLNLPYVWGATGPDSYDCSGYTQGSWRAAGLNLSRTSRQQYAGSLKISYNDLRPGDLVFWGSSSGDASSIYHVAMWAGNGQIVEAARPGVPTRLTAMRWANTMDFAGRP